MALLEAMQEYQVTLEGDTLALPEPFIVIRRPKIRSNTKGPSRFQKRSWIALCHATIGIPTLGGGG